MSYYLNTFNPNTINEIIEKIKDIPDLIFDGCKEGELPKLDISKTYKMCYIDYLHRIDIKNFNPNEPLYPNKNVEMLIMPKSMFIISIPNSSKNSVNVLSETN